MSQIPLHPPSRGLEGKMAIVTGAGCAGEGIGTRRTISVMLAEEGCNAQKTAEMSTARSQRAKALPLKSDFTVAADCEAAVQASLKEFGRLDILVNNVGIGGAAGNAVEVDKNAWAKGLEVNVGSKIVNMGSVASLKVGTPYLLYPMSEGAVVHMTRAMAAHHAPDGIRIDCMLYTPMMYAGGMRRRRFTSVNRKSTLKTSSLLGDCAIDI
ncbi:NAD(P)-binding protein [Didymella exigua CBS 183.55]|uniref:NAD(P)-binding protein n=1 Tax=Didymella exigua CBS 183.55 TaxID=1150837 RepID=A0A6A5S1B5_9PLEO|nr:NAD(P)-binding protein [Didymella exigua CBS 183.55]KAF1933579.1 NAD(P)-binding protein [Didymella exigua CBS 183.55]